MKYNGYLFVRFVALWTLLVVGLNVGTVEGLDCPVCHHIGPFGSTSEDCTQMLPCNNDRDLVVARQAMNVIRVKIRQGLATDEYDDDEPDDFQEQLRPRLTRGLPSRFPPVCIKALGYATPEGYNQSYPYATAKCESGDRYKVMHEDDPCEINIAPDNDFSTNGINITIDEMCVCDNTANQKECQIQNGDLDGETVNLIRNLAVFLPYL